MCAMHTDKIGFRLVELESKDREGQMGGGGRGVGIMPRLEKHSILESFTSLSSEFIIPWSNTNIK